MKKRKIESLETTDGYCFYPCARGESKKDECSIKHIGRQIYLVGYFDSINGGVLLQQNPINRYILLFPSGINQINYKPW